VTAIAPSQSSEEPMEIEPSGEVQLDASHQRVEGAPDHEGEGALIQSVAALQLPQEVFRAALTHGQHEVTAWLDRGGYVDALSSSGPRRGFSLLMAACLSGNLQMVELLLVRGAAIDLQSPVNRSTALIAAALREDPSCGLIAAASACEHSPGHGRQKTALQYALQGFGHYLGGEAEPAWRPPHWCEDPDWIERYRRVATMLL
jgi:hypothetical protein